MAPAARLLRPATAWLCPPTLHGTPSHRPRGPPHPSRASARAVPSAERLSPTSRLAPPCQPARTRGCRLSEDGRPVGRRPRPALTESSPPREEPHPSSARPQAHPTIPPGLRFPAHSSLPKFREFTVCLAPQKAKTGPRTIRQAQETRAQAGVGEGQTRALIPRLTPFRVSPMGTLPAWQKQILNLKGMLQMARGIRSLLGNVACI